MTRILYVSPYFWPEEIGSAPCCSDLAFHLAAQGHEVRTVAFRPHYPAIEPFGAWAGGVRDRESKSGVEIERVAVQACGAGGFKDRLRNDIRFFGHMIFGALGRRFRKTDAIVAYVPSLLTVFGAKAVKLAIGAPILAVVHDIESGLASSLGIIRNSLTLRIMRLVERIGVNFADQVVVLTEGMAEELRGMGARRPIKVVSIWGSVVPEVLRHFSRGLDLWAYSNNVTLDFSRPGKHTDNGFI